MVEGPIPSGLTKSNTKAQERCALLKEKIKNALGQWLERAGFGQVVAYSILLVALLFFSGMASLIDPTKVYELEKVISFAITLIISVMILQIVGVPILVALQTLISRLTSMIGRKTKR